MTGQWQCYDTGIRDVATANYSAIPDDNGEFPYYRPPAKSSMKFAENACIVETFGVIELLYKGIKYQQRILLH